MNPLRFSAYLGSALAFTSVANAHPGHDGHELTWDFQHLVEHPIATIACFAVVGAAVWGLQRLVRRSRSESAR